jgi:hypothetical protein
LARKKKTKPGKLGRNDTCPCGSGVKYKRCCLVVHERARRKAASPWAPGQPDGDDLDVLSNGVLDLIRAGDLDTAAEHAQKLLDDYPDVPDGLERTAQVLEARGQLEEAAIWFRKAGTFCQVFMDWGYEPEGIDWYFDKADAVEDAAAERASTGSDAAADRAP